MLNMSIKILAPAKINIGLKVFRKNQGEEYHKIESVFQTVNLFDELEVELIEGTDFCKVECDSFELPKSNTFTKTYESFVKKTGKNTSVCVFVKKHIPAGGGLGGGSSDGAYFLKALAELNNIDLTRELAFSVASEVGSDVFFFLGLKNGVGSALVSGRGEIVREIDSRKLNVVLIFPNVFSSTKEAYELIDEAYSKSSLIEEYLDFDKYEENYREGISKWKFKNTFTSVLSLKYPKIAEAMSDLENVGSTFTDMTGSGSVVFGVFETEESAKNAISKLDNKWRCVFA